ncbi:hypothetical protein JOC24_006691 [Streptomyces sp. HB132]|nr:hypothetical protein [Streptomyces sp. HB132]
MPWKHTPRSPTARQRRSDADEPTARIDADAFWRLVPDWVPRTGYAMPSRHVLRDVEAGLRKRVRTVSDPTVVPALHVPAPEPVPVEGCDVCGALTRQRVSAHAAGSIVTVRSCNEEIANHPHRRADRE